MVSTATGSFAKLKIISGATFRIIGLTKIPKIEFLPLDWIYRSIRIMTVSMSKYMFESKKALFAEPLNMRQVIMQC